MNVSHDYNVMRMWCGHVTIYVWIYIYIPCLSSVLQSSLLCIYHHSAALAHTCAASFIWIYNLHIHTLNQLHMHTIHEHDTLLQHTKETHPCVHEWDCGYPFLLCEPQRLFHLSVSISTSSYLYILSKVQRSFDQQWMCSEPLLAVGDSWWLNCLAWMYK